MSADDWYEDPPIVLDFGSNTTRLGFSGEDGPRITIPTVTGRYWFRGTSSGFRRAVYYGDEVNQTPVTLVPTHPIKQGIVSNWEDFHLVCIW